MLQARFRFHGHASLKYLYAKGQTVRGRSMALRFVANPRRQTSRCAVVVAKKVLKSSPKRNRVRRRIYEVVRVNWQHIAPGFDLMLSAYEPQLFDAPHAEIEGTIIHLLKQAKVWRNFPEV